MIYNFHELQDTLITALRNLPSLGEDCTLLNGIYYYYGLDVISDDQHLIGGPYKIPVILARGNETGRLYSFDLRVLLKEHNEHSI